MEKATILTVDENPEAGKIIRQYFEGDGHIVHTAKNADESLFIFNHEQIDIILLDAGGIDLMTNFRSQKKVPIIIMSKKSDPTDRIVGLEMGADDYMTKPFHMRELSARIKSVLRRANIPAGNNESNSGHDPEEEKTEIFFFRNLVMNCRKYEICNENGESLSLTSGEFELLHALATSPNRVLKREQIFEITRKIDYNPYDRAVDIQIGRLRKKLNDSPRTPTLIKTVRGVGYMFIGDIKTLNNPLPDGERV